jgi:hypothetical protein
MWKVSDVMKVSIPSGVGYGFNVTTEGASRSFRLRTERRRRPKQPHSRLP